MDNADFSRCWYDAVCEHKYCQDGNTEHCTRWLEMNYLMENSGLPKVRQYPTPMYCDDVDYDMFCKLSDIKDTVDTFVQSGENLYICGHTTGNGKTTWAIKLLLKYFDCVWAGNGFHIRGYFQHVPTLFNVLKDFSQSSNALKSVLEDADLVVWDDIASSNMSGYDNSNLLMLLDQRILAGKSNIFTGNLVTTKELEQALGNRLTSRVLSGLKIELKGKDRRK